jgi:hypothetical protein
MNHVERRHTKACVSEARYDSLRIDIDCEKFPGEDRWQLPQRPP